MRSRHAVYIASAICTNNLPLDYTNTRSFFSHEQRYSQSIKTIQAVREKIPDVYIIFIEGTRIAQHMREEISRLTDHFHDASEQDWVLDNVNGPYKSKGEIAMCLSYLQSQHFKENMHTFKSISKISGRYKPEDGFSLHVVPEHIVAKVEYNPQYHATEYMSTMFYTVPSDLFEAFVEVCQSCYGDDGLNNGRPLECALLDTIKSHDIKVFRTPKLFVGGEYGPWGGYVMH